MNILQEIEVHAKKHPDRIAFSNRQRALTYNELWERSDALASWILSHCGIVDKTPVIVYGHKEPEMLISFLACVKAGRAYIPVDISTPADRLQRIINHSQTKLILSPVPLPESLTTSSCVLKSENQLQEIIQECAGMDLTSDFWVKEKDNFYIIYTSGSTGDPKGVQITFQCLSSFLQWMSTDFGIDTHSVFMNQAPLSFDLSVMDLYTSLVTGGTVWSVDKEMIANPKILFEHFKNAYLHVWVSTPSFVEFCLMDASFNRQLLPTLTTFLFCGETLNKTTAQKLLERFPNSKIFNTYGPTESTVAVTSIQITPSIVERYPTLPVGKVKPDCEIRVVKENGEVQGDRGKGEIIIIGPSVSKGYYQNREKTNHSFYKIDGKRAYRTGDTGYTQDGLLFFNGRSDFQIKLQGYRMELEDIEENLRKVDFIANAVVVPKYKNGKCEHLVGVVVSKTGTPIQPFSLAVKLKAELSTYLPSYMIPKKFIFKESLPLTANGKIDRKAISRELEL